MKPIPPALLSATITLLAVFFYFFTAFRVGQLRGKHDVRAPATSGHPEFDRAYRVQLNTLEQLGLFLPLLWLATLYPLLGAWIAAAVGVVWLVARVLYARAYMADPDKRLIGAGLTGLCTIALLILALIGIGMGWLGLR